MHPITHELRLVLCVGAEFKNQNAVNGLPLQLPLHEVALAVSQGG